MLHKLIGSIHYHLSYIQCSKMEKYPEYKIGIKIIQRKSDELKKLRTSNSVLLKLKTD